MEDGDLECQSIGSDKKINVGDNIFHGTVGVLGGIV